jgi:endonuclease/exonuclease/phosphatase family metal-dependent hydrolase
MEKQKLIRMVEATAVFLFFLQAVRVLFSVLFGVIYDAIFTGPITLGAVVTNLLVVVAFLAPLFAPRRRVRWMPLAVTALVFLTRIPLTLNDPQVRLYSSLVIVAGGGLYAVSLLREDADTFPTALIAALAVDQLFRAWGNSFDVTLRAGWLPVQIAISAALLLLSVFVSRLPRRQAPAVRIGFLGGLAIGAFLFLQTSLLSLPNAVARWSAWSYSVLTPSLLLVTLLPVLWRTLGLPRPWMARRRLWGFVWVALACAGLTVGHLLGGLPAAIAILLAQWVILLCLPSTLRVPAVRKERNGLHLALGLLFFLLINFAYAFAFTYAYTLDVFRGAGLPVFLVAGLLATLPAAWRGIRFPKPPAHEQRWWVVAAVTLLVALGTVFAFPPSPRIKQAGPNVRVGTYNIHYGYNTHWNFYLEEMARTIEESGVDIVAMQEVDAGRITSYSVDDALWLARRLRMEVCYQPTIEHLTGIAVLYRFPLQEAEGRLLTSRLEQTAIIRTRLNVGGKPLDAYGIWLGLKPEERAVQLGEAIDFIAAGPAVFGGDFNAMPDSPVYKRLAEAGFVDPFIGTGFEPPPTSPSEEPEERIDYVWIRELRPVDAQVLESTASDHRMVVVEAALE